MRLNTKKVKEIMLQKGLEEEDICIQTGLDKHSVRWIFDNGFASEEAMERIASVVGAEAGAILLPEITGSTENAIEFSKDSERATVTFTQGRYKSRVKRLAESHPEECRIIAENEDGSLCAHIPVKWVRISPPKAVSELQREIGREAARRNFSNIGNNLYENGQISIPDGSVEDC